MCALNLIGRYPDYPELVATMAEEEELKPAKSLEWAQEVGQRRTSLAFYRVVHFLIRTLLHRWLRTEIRGAEHLAWRSMIDEVMFEIREMTGQTYHNVYSGERDDDTAPPAGRVGTVADEPELELAGV